MADLNDTLTPPTEAEPPGIPTDLAAEALRQMVEDAGPTGAAEEDLRAAFDELQDIFVDVVIWETWLRGMVTFAAENGNLVLKAPWPTPWQPVASTALTH